VVAEVVGVLGGRGVVVSGLVGGLRRVNRRRVLTVHNILEHLDAVSVLLSNYLEDVVLLVVEELGGVFAVFEHLHHLVELLLADLLLEELAEQHRTVLAALFLRIEQQVLREQEVLSLFVEVDLVSELVLGRFGLDPLVGRAEWVRMLDQHLLLVGAGAAGHGLAGRLVEGPAEVVLGRPIVEGPLLIHNVLLLLVHLELRLQVRVYFYWLSEGLRVFLLGVVGRPLLHHLHTVPLPQQRVLVLLIERADVRLILVLYY